ncbi:MAG: hypothetical protein O9341_03770 [Paucibacter sp.]|nr:hypothetical protein [Roseateles sp.]
MGALWSQYRPLLLAPWQMQRNASPLAFFIGWGLSLLGFGLGLGLGFWLARPEVAWRLAAVTLSCMVAVPWVICFNGLLAQNHPHAARLVPGHVQRLRTVAVVGYGLCTLLCAGLLASQFPGGQAWLPGVALALFVLALTARWVQLWFWISLILFSIPWWGKSMPVLIVWSAVLAWHQGQPWSMSVLSLLLLPWGVAGLIQAGGSRHARQFQARQTWRRLFESQSMGVASHAPVNVPVDRMGQLFRWMQPLWTRRLLRQAQPTPASVMARIDLVSLGQAHWTSQLSSVTVVLALMGLFFAAMGWWGPVDFWSELLQHGSLGLSFGFASMCLGILLTVPANLHRSRREQALLMLLPGAPRGQDLNRMLARRLMSQLFWSLGVSLILCAALQSVPGPQSVQWLGVHLCLAYLVFGCTVVLRDWSREHRPSSHRALLPFAFTALMVLALQGLQWLGLPILGQIGLVLLLVLALARYRWQRLVLGAARAMPVGRWA